MEKIDIIFADQDQSYLEDARRILKVFNEGYSIHSVTSAEECLAKIKTNKFHLLLLDSHLANGDYLSVLDSTVRARPEMPIIVFVDEGRDDMAVAAMKRGAFDYIMKTKDYLTTLPYKVKKAVRLITDSEMSEPSQKSRPSIFKEPLIVEQETKKSDRILQRAAEFISPSKSDGEIPGEVIAHTEKEAAGSVFARQNKSSSLFRDSFKPRKEDVDSAGGEEDRSRGTSALRSDREETVAVPGTTPLMHPGEERDESQPLRTKFDERIKAKAREVLFSAPEEEILPDLEEYEEKPVAGATQKVGVDDSAAAVVEGESQLPGTGTIVLDQKLRFLSVNKIVRELTEYSEEELLELALPDLLIPAKEDDFFEWLETVTEGQTPPFQCTLRGKKGEPVDVEMTARIFRENGGQIAGYRVQVQSVSAPVPLKTTDQKVDQLLMFNELVTIISDCYNKPLAVLLDRIAKLVCQIFKFKRSTVALLDRRRQVFVKQAMVGYRSSVSDEPRSMEVPVEVIDRIFSKRFKIKVLYYNKELRDSRNTVDPLISERRTQERRSNNEWHRRDLILLNLLDSEHHTFGYLSLDDPIEGHIPNRDTFFNLEIFGQLASFAIENYGRFSSLERRTRRLKQILVTSNIFKLYLSLTELLKEVVWSVKFSLDFNMVALALISKKTSLLEMKAVACEDKIKMLQIREMAFDLNQISGLLKERYRRSKSYLIDQEESALGPLKSICRQSNRNNYEDGSWPPWGMILVPLRSRSDKIIGFLIVDDPVDYRIPSMETIRTLEILANQVAVAIDNRVMYVRAKKQLYEATEATELDKGTDEANGGGLRKLMDKLFH